MLINLKCPQCGGTLEVDDSKEYGKCSFCEAPVLIAKNAQNAPGNTPAPTQIVIQNNQKRGMPALVAIVIFIILCSALFTVIDTFVEKAADIPLPQQQDARDWSDNFEDREYVRDVNGHMIPSGVISAAEFISAAEKLGYHMIIEDDYDGFNTFWAGAHKFPPDEQNFIEEERIYVIDYTIDASERNARVEYWLYVDQVKELGGKSLDGSGDNYEFQVNSSDLGFGIAYRIGTVNMLAITPPEYKDDIMRFFDIIGFGVSLDKLS